MEIQLKPKDIDLKKFNKGYSAQLNEYKDKDVDYCRGKIAAKCFEDVMATIVTAYYAFHGDEMDDNDDVNAFINYDEVHEMVMKQLLNTKIDEEQKEVKSGLNYNDTNHKIL
jgi:CRISPR/Cas system-associated endonuclease Cas1